MDLQVNWLRNNSTPVNKTMPFSYPRVHSSSGIELISQITKAYKELISSNSIITYNTVIPNCTKICHKNNIHNNTTNMKSRQNPLGKCPQQSHHFFVAGYSLPLEILTKSKVSHTSPVATALLFIQRNG